MYERFTDRARKVMFMANQEAQRFNHTFIATEHILLGLVKEGANVATTMLRNLKIDLRRVRLEVEKVVQAGPDMVTVGKLPHTPMAKKVIGYSIEEARKFCHNYVGTEHLFFGILRQEEGVACQILKGFGITLDRAYKVYKGLTEPVIELPKKELPPRILKLRDGVYLLNYFDLAPEDLRLLGERLHNPIVIVHGEEKTPTREVETDSIDIVIDEGETTTSSP